MPALIVNLFGGPCAGKSTVRADIFRLLKQRGINCEEVHEHAKKLVWADRKREMTCQPYIYGKQLRDMEILLDQVDVIITDSPLLLCAYYTERYRPDAYPKSFMDFAIDHFKNMGGLNVFIRRAGLYNPSGRNQTEEQADEVADELRSMLIDENIGFSEVLGDDAAAYRILDMILLSLGKPLDPVSPAEVVEATVPFHKRAIASVRKLVIRNPSA